MVCGNETNVSLFHKTIVYMSTERQTYAIFKIEYTDAKKYVCKFLIEELNSLTACPVRT